MVGVGGSSPLGRTISKQQFSLGRVVHLLIYRYCHTLRFLKLFTCADAIPLNSNSSCLSIIAAADDLILKRTSRRSASGCCGTTAIPSGHSTKALT